MDETLGQDDGTIRARLRWVMSVRVVIAFVLLGAALLLQARAGRSLQATAPLYIITGFICFLTIVYSILLIRQIPSATTLAFIQFHGDLLLETLAVYETGIIESPFNVLYLISIITASMLLSMRGGLIIAAGAGVAFGGLVDLQYYQLLPALRAATLPVGEVVYTLFLNLMSFFLVGALSGVLARQVRTAERELQVRGTDLATLKTLHDRIVQSLSTGLFTTDLAGRISSWNSAAEAITGRPAVEVLGRAVTTVFADGAGPPTAFHDDRLPIRQDLTIHHRDGRPRILDMTFSTLKDERGVATGLIGQFQDITEARAKETAMQQQERLAMIGELAAGVAHEVRNPLASLSGSMQVLNRELNLTHEHRYLMDIAIKEAQRLNAIITDFLLYARPAPLVAQPCDLKALLEETVALVKTSDEYQNTTTVTLDPWPISVMADPDRLRQVFWNLAKNAVQAMPRGGRLNIRTTSVGDVVQVMFEDTGEGIPAQDLGRVFDPFFTTKSQGSGLGLSIVKRIVEEHGGDVTVESRAGDGTRVSLTLPLAPAPVTG